MTDPSEVVPDEPALPPGRTIELPGRGTTFIREIAGPRGAPTLVLLHGWTATADLNWFRTFGALGEQFRVVALDHRGHGQGIRSRRPFRLEDCADDVAALAIALGIRRYIPVGYSMGGPVAQLVWRRHPEQVAGLVLCATSRSFSGTREERLNWLGVSTVAAMSRFTPPAARQRVIDRTLLARRSKRGYADWAIDQMRQHDVTALLEAGRALGRFSSREWIGSVDVPAAVVVMTEDQLVPPRRQIGLAEAIPGATRHDVAAGHDACVTRADLFVPALVAACRSVADRARPGQRRVGTPVGLDGRY